MFCVFYFFFKQVNCSWLFPSHLLFFFSICFSYLQILPHTLHIDLLLCSMSLPGHFCPTGEGPCWLLCCGSPDLEMALEFISPLLLNNNSYWELLAQRLTGFQVPEARLQLILIWSSSCITGFGGVTNIWNFIYTALWWELLYAMATRTEHVGKAWMCL